MKDRPDKHRRPAYGPLPAMAQPPPPTQDRGNQADVRAIPNVGVITLPERGGPSKGGGGTSYTFSGAGVVLATGTTPQTVTVAEGVLDQVAADTTVGNTTVETTIYSKSIVGGTLGTVGKLRLTLLIKYTDTSGANPSTLTLRFKYGTRTLVTYAMDSAGNVFTAAPLKNVFELNGDTATNAQLAYMTQQGQQSTTDWGASSEDSTVAQTLTVTAQWGATSTTRTMTMEHATLELVK